MFGTCDKHGTATKDGSCMTCLLDSPVTKVPKPFVAGTDAHGRVSFFAKPKKGA